MAKNYRIAVIPGDGIGKEVVPEGVRVLEAAGRKFGIEFKWDEFPWSCEYRAKHGRMMPEDGLATIRKHDAIFFGGRIFEGTEREPVVQQSTFTRHGVDRILKYAYDLARSRPKKHLTSATKSNGISITMPYWDERVRAMAARYPEVKTDQYHIDILSAHFVLHPHWFDVVVGSNLFGDILSDLGPACTGTIGIAPSANLNPEREYPSMFEPVHGSAPDIAGRNIANPIGQI